MAEFDDLYARYASAVFRYALKCVGQRAVAEDITSEVFLSLYRHLSTVDQQRLPGWLFAAARHRAIDYWRRADVEERYLRLLVPKAAALQPSLEQWLDDVPRLKPVHRACLILRYVHGMDREAIARRLGLTVTQVKGHLQYALKILRRDLEEVSP
jgi:RNA polymerase sigma-70 factor (ECF subfamily)